MELFIAFIRCVFIHAHILCMTYIHIAHTTIATVATSIFNTFAFFFRVFIDFLVFAFSHGTAEAKHRNETNRNESTRRALFAVCWLHNYYVIMLIWHSKRHHLCRLRNARSQLIAVVMMYFEWNAMRCNTLLYFQLSNTMAWPNVLMILCIYWLKPLECEPNVYCAQTNRAMRCVCVSNVM